METGKRKAETASESRRDHFFPSQLWQLALAAVEAAGPAQLQVGYESLLFMPAGLSWTSQTVGAGVNSEVITRS